METYYFKRTRTTEETIRVRAISAEQAVSLAQRENGVIIKEVNTSGPWLEDERTRLDMSEEDQLKEGERCFIVRQVEEYETYYEVKAKMAQEAIEQVQNGEGDELISWRQYRGTLDDQEYTQVLVISEENGEYNSSMHRMWKTI